MVRLDQPNTVEVEKRIWKKEAPAERMCQSTPDDFVKEDKDEVFEDSSDTGQVLRCPKSKHLNRLLLFESTHKNVFQLERIFV